MSKKQDKKPPVVKMRSAFIPMKNGEGRLPSQGEMMDAASKADWFNNLARAVKIETGMETIIILAVEKETKIQFVGVTSSGGPEEAVKALEEGLFGMKEAIKQQQGQESQAIPAAELLNRVVN